MEQSDHDLLITVERDLKHTLERLDSIEKTMVIGIQEMKALEDEMSRRIADMERQWSNRKGFVTGVMTTVGTIAGGVGAAVTYFFTKP